MSKAFLIDAHFWSPSDREYKCSFPLYPDEDNCCLPMTFVTSTCDEDTNYYYLYKTEINTEVVVDVDDYDEGFLFDITYTEDDGSTGSRHSRARVKGITDEDIFDDLIDTEGYVVMRHSWCGAVWGKGSCLFRFKSPLVIVDNV